MPDLKRCTITPKVNEIRNSHRPAQTANHCEINPPTKKYTLRSFARSFVRPASALFQSPLLSLPTSQHSNGGLFWEYFACGHSYMGCARTLLFFLTRCRTPAVDTANTPPHLACGFIRLPSYTLCGYIGNISPSVQLGFPQALMASLFMVNYAIMGL